MLELTGTNVATTYISAPADPHASLGVKLPFLCMTIKNLKKYFSFEITVTRENVTVVVSLLAFWEIIVYEPGRTKEGGRKKGKNNLS